MDLSFGAECLFSRDDAALSKVENERGGGRTAAGGRAEGGRRRARKRLIHVSIDELLVNRK